MLERLVLGDTLNFTTSVVDYPAASSWVLKFRLVPRTTGSAIDITTAADSTDTTLHRAQVSAATTASWTAGTYSWHSWVEKGAEKYSVSSGVIQLMPDPRTATTLDNRTTAQTALDNVQALLAGKATSGVLSYRIGERTLQSYSMAELLQLESKLKADVQREEQAAALAAGQPSRRQLYVRLGRV